MPQCQAINCSNKQGKGGKSFFQIPHPQKSKAHRALCKKWIEILRNDKLSIETFVNNKNRVVCEDHFPPESFEGVFASSVAGSLSFFPKRKQLKPYALPTLVQAYAREEKTRRSTNELLKKRHEAQVYMFLFFYFYTGIHC